jgi:hypothetical protein
VKFDANPAKSAICRRLAHAFLTARFNQEVSTHLRRASGVAIKRKCWKQSKCPENNTRGKTAAPQQLCSDNDVSRRREAVGRAFPSEVKTVRVKKTRESENPEPWF